MISIPPISLSALFNGVDREAFSENLTLEKAMKKYPEEVLTSAAHILKLE